MKFSCVSPCSCICLVHIYFPFQKKLHLDSFSVYLCSAFPASNSLQIFQLIPCKSLWDLKVPSELRWQVFYCDELGHTGLFSSAQPNSLGATEAHNSVLPISLQERQLATYSCSPFAPAPLNDSCPLPASHSTCFVTQGPNPSAITQKSRRALLGNWCQRGRERSHQSSMLNHFYRGRGYSGGVCKKPQMLGVQEERSYMSLRGERHVHIWSYLIACISSVVFSFALIFCSLSSPNIPCKIQGEQDI